MSLTTYEVVFVNLWGQHCQPLDRHFHVPAFILALITEAGVLSVIAEALVGFALIDPKGFDLGLEAGFPLFPPINANDNLFTSRA